MDLPTTPEEAAAVFGTRLPIAEAYVRFLATAGMERGLIGPREGDRLWSRHVLNSTAVASAIPLESVTQGIKVTDVGSGAGLPGIPLALHRPDFAVTLVEPLLRRTTFLSEFIDAHDLPITVVRGRAEEKRVRDVAGNADVVTARAVAPMGKLCRWCAPLLREGGTLIALKGESAAQEIERDRREIEKAGLERPRVQEVLLQGGETTNLVMATRTAKLKQSMRRRRH